MNLEKNDLNTHGAPAIFFKDQQVPYVSLDPPGLSTLDLSLFVDSLYSVLKAAMPHSIAFVKYLQPSTLTRIQTKRCPRRLPQEQPVHGHRPVSRLRQRGHPDRLCLRLSENLQLCPTVKAQLFVSSF